MRKLTGEQIIRTYIDFFREHGHMEVESGSLIPHDDPSVLWINAGVTPLKKYFDGTLVPNNRRITSCQKCIRTGDIESVGKTARHHTFFQMLGNFSIGDYFKDDALKMALELLTSNKYFGMDINKLYVTVYPNDKEAYDIWIKLGIKPSHIFKLKENYWEIGEGPSGPDSEIFYDRGSKYDPKGIGIKLLAEEIENDRYIEIWNNVFSQYNAKAGIPREEYEELPSKNIDTGMGVERMACILQETETNYETDLFMPIITAIEDICHIKYFSQMEFKVIADHIRTLTFAISDGATFENFGRGYVLRRLLRRSVRIGKKLNINRSFMAELVDVVIDKYSNIYPDLVKNKELIKKMITKEEELFHKTLLSGEKRLEEIFNSNKDKIISGKDAFKLYDTYGFPIELTQEYAEEKGFTIDMNEFNTYMEAQKETARQSRKVENSMNLQNEKLINFKDESTFVGYETLGLETEIIAIFKNDDFVNESDTDCYIVLKECPFYAESGGQVADSGYLKNDDCKLEVEDVIKAPNHQHLIKVKVLDGKITKNAKILTHVLQEKRENICKNHSSIHLLQKTLQEMLGSSVHQAGSKVDDESFRFDFTYHGRLSDKLLVDIENKVNERIASATPTQIEYMSLDKAKSKGAMALFEDKYGDTVRVVTMGDSIELCGGTHVTNTSEIKKFAIINLENKGADTYRIEGTTDENIENKLNEVILIYDKEIKKLLGKASKIVDDAKEIDINLDFNFTTSKDHPFSYDNIKEAKEVLEQTKIDVKELEKSYQEKKIEKSTSDLSAFLDNKEIINNIEVIIAITEDYDVPTLKQILDAVCNKLNKYFVLLANTNDNNANFICKSNADELNCGDIIKKLSVGCLGNGGGSKNYAQGGGTDTKDLLDLLADIKDSI